MTTKPLTTENLTQIASQIPPGSSVKPTHIQGTIKRGDFVLLHHGRGTKLAVIVDMSEMHPGHFRGCVYRSLGKGFTIERTIFSHEIRGVPRLDDWRVEAAREELRVAKQHPAARLVRCTVDADGVDEVVVGDWFHLEAMDTRPEDGTVHYHLRIGDRAFAVFIEKGGKVASVEQD